jgi:hypothetical protein
MSFRPIHAVTLEPHAESRSDAVRSIDARVCRMPGGMLAVTYVLDADLDRLRIPPPQPPRIVDRLWQYTCFEIFIRADFEEPVARQADRSSFDSGALRSGRTHGVERRPSAYHEFNFSPSGEWAVYAFERYREGAPLMEEPPDPRVMVRSAAGKLELNASLRLDALSPVHAHAAVGGRGGQRWVAVVLGARASSRQARLSSS